MSRILTCLVFIACVLPAGANADPLPGDAKLLVATEKVGGDIFVQTVILLLQHDETGAIGLVINRPTEVGMDELVDDDDALSAYSGPIYWGGPVQMNSLSALMKSDTSPGDAERVFGSVYLVEGRFTGQVSPAFVHWLRRLGAGTTGPRDCPGQLARRTGVGGGRVCKRPG
jgi:putative transcriptional regulator